jgi:hypothetical protein
MWDFEWQTHWDVCPCKMETEMMMIIIIIKGDIKRGDGEGKTTEGGS